MKNYQLMSPLHLIQEQLLLDALLGPLVMILWILELILTILLQEVWMLALISMILIMPV